MESTRRIVMFNWVTADGYFAGPDGNLEWVVPDEEQAKAAAEGIPGFDTVLFGRRTYELFEGFWRHAVDDSPTAPDPHRPGERSREHRAIAVWLNEVTKLVFSRTLKDVTWRNSRTLNELGDDRDPFRLAIGLKLASLVGDGQIVLRRRPVDTLRYNAARPGDAKAGVALAFMRDLRFQNQFFEPSSSSRSGPKWTSNRSSSASVTGTRSGQSSVMPRFHGSSGPRFARGRDAPRRRGSGIGA